MIIYLILLGLLCIWGMKFTAFREDYLSKEQTDALKGVFGLMIFMSHVRAHIPLEGTADMLYSAVFTRLGQMTVVPFLFYSGYSIIYNIQNKPGYMESFFRKRIVKLLLDYNLVVIIYGVYNFCRGVVFPVENYLLAWCGWKALVGNGFDGTWYIFVTLLLYTATFAAHYCVQKFFVQQSTNKLLSIFVIVFLFSVGLVAALYSFGKEEFWYNTLMAFSFGMLYGIFKQRIDHAMQIGWIYVVVFCGVCIGAGTILVSGQKDVICYSLMGVLFMHFVTMITMHIRIQNAVLIRIGKLSLGLYTLQRLFMIFFETWGLDKYPVFFTALCLAVTVIASVLHRLVADKINDILLSYKKKNSESLHGSEIK